MSDQPSNQHHDDMPLGHGAAANRLLAARGSIYAAFDNLACGMDHDEALAYLDGSPHFASLPEDVRGKVAGLCMGFALTAVEGDRKLRRLGRWFTFGVGDSGAR
jgi:hypothetical protein